MCIIQIKKCMVTKMLCSLINHKLVANVCLHPNVLGLGFQNDTSISIHKRMFPAPAACLIKLPSHPTPASYTWRQLCDRIGLLGHSSSWLELEVHWTSSRKIGPVPAPKWALLYDLPPGECKGNWNVTVQCSSALLACTCPNNVLHSPNT